jgi:hypothetical protein
MRSTASIIARLTPIIKSIAFSQVLQRVFSFFVEIVSSMCLRDCHGKKEQIIHFGSSLHRRRGGICAFCGKKMSFYLQSSGFPICFIMGKSIRDCLFMQTKERCLCHQEMVD